MPLRKKYPIDNWVISSENVLPGETVAFFCEDTQEEVFAEV
jgi:hypothetical protein